MTKEFAKDLIKKLMLSNYILPGNILIEFESEVDDEGSISSSGKVKRVRARANPAVINDSETIYIDISDSIKLESNENDLSIFLFPCQESHKDGSLHFFTYTTFEEFERDVLFPLKLN